MAQGKELFAQNCSVCHGPAGDGTTQGPPLVHIIYEPNHHADAAFILAARNGVRAHHWRFGDMAPLPDVTDEMVLEIVGYIRWLQRQVGIE
ncbi:MAG: cytochrome c [Gemmatimonadetes bacterium]|jgi:mono/diheme cytochrome c family protein|nr:cytochrome c [Gemmatimonadota bacterium]